jgi:hypothetical protein
MQAELASMQPKRKHLHPGRRARSGGTVTSLTAAAETDAIA